MSYVSEHLAADEQVVHLGKVHWFGYVPPAIFFVLALMFSRGADTLFGILMLVALGLLVRTVILQKTTELAITTKRIIAKGGLIQRYTVEMQHRQVESIRVYQSALGRILNYGSVHLQGVGGGRAPINFIVAPLEFRKHAMEQVDRLQGGAGPVVQNAANIPSMQDLIAMKEKGHITDEEFAQFKKKILAQ
jgi:uncharacterized membrane protein YdbT with pleckstrin-like domain